MSAGEGPLPPQPSHELRETAPVGPAAAGTAARAPAGAPPRRLRPIELAALLALVVLADLTLWGGRGGVGDAVLLTGALSILVVAAPVRRFSLRLLVTLGLVLALAARSAFQGSLWTTFLGICGLTWVAVTLRSGGAFVPEAFLSGLLSTVTAPVRLWSYGAGAIHLATGGRVRGIRWGHVLVPLAVVGLFGLVFLAANPLLERWMDEAWSALLASEIDLAWRAAFWLASAALAAGLLAPTLRDLPGWEGALGPGHRSDGLGDPPAGASVALARNTLVGLNLLFLGYNALDAVYLWAGAPPPGVDHATYAHRGVFWLTLALLMTTLTLGLIFRGAMNVRARETQLVRTLGLVWAGQSFVLAAGTFRRIEMYVDDSGLTTLRCLGIAGVGLVAVGLALVVLKVARRHTALWLLRRQLDAFVVTLVAWTALPVEAFVWHHNAARILAGEERPLIHLYEQPVSTEGVPPFTALLDHPDAVVAAVAAERLARLSEQVDEESREARRWTALELSRERARAALAGSRDRIARSVSGVSSTEAAFWELRRRAYVSNGLDPGTPPDRDSWTVPAPALQRPLPGRSPLE